MPDPAQQDPQPIVSDATSDTKGGMKKIGSVVAKILTWVRTVVLGLLRHLKSALAAFVKFLKASVSSLGRTLSVIGGKLLAGTVVGIHAIARMLKTIGSALKRGVEAGIAFLTKAPRLITNGLKTGWRTIKTYAAKMLQFFGVIDASKERDYRCPVCNRLAQSPGCPTCKSDNASWRALRSWDHLNRFPIIVRLAVLILILLQLRTTWKIWTSTGPAYPLELRTAAALSLLVSLLIVALITVFRSGLRNYELLRQAKLEHKGLSLAVLGTLTFGVLLILLASVSLLHAAVQDFAMGGSWTLSIQDLEGSPVKIFAQENAKVSQPQWSQAGDKLVYSAKQGADWEIYVYDVTTRETVTLTNNTAQDMTPSWLKDGAIIFASDRTGSLEWYTIDASGNEAVAERLAAWRRTAEASWSPDGKRYAYTEPGRALYFATESMTAIEEKYPLLRSVTVSVMYPLLILAVMLFGAAGYVKKLENDTHKPVFLNDRTMVTVAFESFLNEMQTRPKDDDSIRLSTIQADVFTFERTANGGLEMIVNYKVEVEETDEKGETRTVPKDVYYEVKTNEWAQIRSVQKCDPRRLQTRMV